QLSGLGLGSPISIVLIICKVYATAENQPQGRVWRHQMPKSIEILINNAII
ncbi:MAG: hypothetical protein ACI9JE_001182, partial [Candidatus Krumholzibacteriia bacterium]